jgi:GT2 family glycosyltransferase
MRIGCVLLTTGERPAELAAALRSIARQRDVEVELVVVLNADRITLALPEDLVAEVVTPGRNLGIPEGRNVGVGALTGCDLVLFLDDDAVLVGDQVLARAARRFSTDPSLGALTMRIVDPDTGRTERRHVPRLRAGDPGRSSWVTTFLGGASVLRLDAFRAAGGLPGEFFYAHEETSLAWRLLDHGYRIAYDADLAIHHPAQPPARHAVYHRLSARNRVLLARKHLPWPVAVVYVLVWMVLSVARSPGGRATTLRGFAEGLRMAGVERAPIRWGTVLRMARYGRPPVI